MKTLNPKERVSVLNQIQKWKSEGVDHDAIEMIVLGHYGIRLHEIESCNAKDMLSNPYKKKAADYDAYMYSNQTYKNCNTSIYDNSRRISVIQEKEREQALQRREIKDRVLARRIAEREKEEEEKMNREEIRRLEDLEARELEEARRKKQEEEEVKIECPICLEPLFSLQTLPFKNCIDIFHVECLDNYIKEEIEKRAFPIHCPNPECKAEIDISDIKFLLEEDAEMLAKFEASVLKSTLESNPDFLNCQTPDCPYMFETSGEDPHFRCLMCQKEYCLKCKVPWHQQMTCEEFQADLEKKKKEYEEYKRLQSDEVFLEFARQNGYKPCPKCQQYCEKISGCKAVTCTRCKTLFCYKCGKEGDGHKCPC